MNDITLHRLKNPDAYQTRQVKKDFKFEMFLQMTVAIPHTVKGIDMTTTYTIFEYMVEIPKASHWLLSKVLSYRNTKSNIATVVGSTPYEKEMIKTGYKTLFNDGIICRIQRGKYMINPKIVLIKKGFEEDAFNNWNAHCHPDAVVKFSIEVLGETYQVDGRIFTELLHVDKLAKATDAELSEFLVSCRQCNWIDENNTPTGRATNDEGLTRALDECKKRGLI